MSSGIMRESPLIRFARDAQATSNAAKSGIISTEKAFLGHINLRGNSSDPGFVAAVQYIVGIKVPSAPNTAAHGHGNTVYWLGPNEWLIVTPGARQAEIARDLCGALISHFAAVTEVGGGQTIISLRGDSVRDLLAKGCPLDLHPRGFGVDRCAQSHLAKAPILIHQFDDAPTFDLIVRRSFADYLWLWLEDAAVEYGHCTEVSTSTTRVRDIA